MGKDDFLTRQHKVSENLFKLSEWTLNKISCVLDVETLPDLSEEELVNLLIALKPTSIKMVTNYLYVIGLYDKYVGRDDSYQMVLHMDRNVIFNHCQTVNTTQKFISNSEFNDLLFNIEMFEESNTLFYTTLLRCIYEGIYSDDMSVVKNLKASDIHGNIVTLREDNGYVYDLEISTELADDLIELSTNNTWQRRNRSGQFEVPIEGLYFDSCFKIENRGNGGNYRFSYFQRLRKISNEYLDYSLKPSYLYVSGIMYRIRLELEKQGFDLKFAFTENRRLPLIVNIIESELKRCNYKKETKYFRQTVSGFIDVFEN